MEFSWNPDTSCKEKLQSSISTHPFSDVPSFSQFSLTCIFHHVWEKNFQFRMFTLLYELNLCIFTHAPVPHSKLQVQFFENLFPPRAKNKGVEETMICFIKIQSTTMKMTWNFSLFIYCMIYNFSKCAGFTVLWIIYVK